MQRAALPLYATLLLNAGMSIFALQSLLGHRYVETTLNYARLYDETMAMQFLNVRAPGRGLMLANA